jgi:Ca2+-binding RTX toxin-like protein
MAITNASLKPFMLNATDIQFLLDQVKFRPLFDSVGNAIINWNGVGAVYDGYGKQIWNGLGLSANAAVLQYGSSYQSVTDLAGLRDPSGHNNNLTLAHAHWGEANQIFPRMATANYGNYSQEVVNLLPDLAVTNSRTIISHGVPTLNVILDINPAGTPTVTTIGGLTISKAVSEQIGNASVIDTNNVTDTSFIDGHHRQVSSTTTIVSESSDTYTYSFDNTTIVTSINGGPAVTTTQNVSTPVVLQNSSPLTVLSNSTALSGGELDLAYHTFNGYTNGVYGAITNGVISAAVYSDTAASVVDYTPRMISRITTTAGVTYDTWANHVAANNALPVNERHALNEIYYDAKGVATVLDWGQLETVANAGLGQVDTQARLLDSAGRDEKFIGGLNPGVSPSNGFFVLFGQFFDHGLDFIDKGGQKSVIKIALAVDDPLYGMTGPDGQPVTSITIARATVDHTDAQGPEYLNHTSPFIDQSQTYGSSLQLTNLLREWVLDTTTATVGDFHAGMKLLDGKTLADTWVNGHGETVKDTLPTLNELRTHMQETGRGGVNGLTWEDVSDLRNRDGSGHVIAGNSGSALILDSNPRFDVTHLHNGTPAQDAVVDAAIAALNADAQATYGPGVSLHINANNKLELSGLPGTGPNPLTGASALFPWVDFSNFSILANHQFGGPVSTVAHAAVGEILMASVGDHYIAGDGRVNENFGLTSIHHIFHEEHNFQVTNLMEALHTQDIASPDGHAKLHDFQVNNALAVNNTNAAGDYLNADDSISWDMDKMFNATKIIVEMEYQHAAVDQYARNVTPNIQEFVGYSPSKDPSVTLEYAQGAFRFGHSTLRETIDTIDPTNGLTGKIMGYALRDAFLNPDKYADIGPAAILLGMSHQQMNEVDEFITPALNQGLLGQALDLAAINIARGRDIGIPTLNDFRAAIGLARYSNWLDFGQNMQHPDSLVNFIAAYAFDGNMAKAETIIGLASGTITAGTAAAMGYTQASANAFLSGQEATPGDGALAFNKIDTWLGGMAEIHQPGGLLGETFDLVFVTQIESLMDGDRFYYLFRLAGQQFAEEVGGGQLKDIVERNSGLSHLNGNIFGYADQYVDFGAKKEVVAVGAEAQTTGNEHKYGDLAAIAAGTMGIYTNGGLNAVNDGFTITINGVTYIQDTRLADTDPLSAFNLNGGQNLDGTPNSGAESNEVIVGTKGNDLLYAQGGDDTVYGEDGNDIIYGGFGIDRLYGGAGSDTLYGGDNPDLMDGGSGDDFIYGESSGSDINGNDQLIGGSGNDFVSGGTGIDKLSGGTGDDHVVGDGDTDPFTHGSDGNDWIEGNSGGDILYGDNGDDLVDGGADQDQLFGGNGDDILRPGDATGALTIGTDEVLGNDGVDVNDKGFDLMDFSDNTPGIAGVTFDLGNQINPAVTVNGTPSQVQSFQIDGVIGTRGADTLTGSGTAAGAGADASIAGNNWLIGGSGSDTLSGDAGDDVIIGGSVRLDALVGHYTTTYTFNNDNDGLTAADVLQDAQYQGASHRVEYTDQVTGGLLAATGFATHFTEMLRSDQFKDVVLGDGGVDVGNILDGGAGNDLLIGGAGADILRGGQGIDWAVYDGVSAGVVATLLNIANNQQNTTSNGSATVGTVVDTFYSIENLIGGSGDDTLTGNNSANILMGGLGNDMLNGAGGNDTASYANATSGVTVSLAIAAAQATGGAGDDTLTSIERLVGSAYADALTGSNGNNDINGGRGNDIINSGGGNDNITWAVGGGFDTVNGQTGTTDRFIVNGDGTAEAFDVYGGTAWSGGTASHIYITRNGTLIADIQNIEEITINTGGGVDTVATHGTFVGTSLNYNTITVDDEGSGQVTVDVTDMTSAHHIKLYSTGGNDVILGVRPQDEIVQGTAPVITVVGNEIHGTSGDDDLDGSRGGDNIYGDGGNDTVDYRDSEHGIQAMLQGVGTGANVGYSWNGVAQNNLYGIANIIGTQFDDVLVGNAGDNVFEGMGGNDTIIGGGGSDTVSFNSSAVGVGVLLAGVSQTQGYSWDGIYQENLYGISNIKGSALNDYLEGNASNNVIEGNGGADTISGGGGSDTASFASLTTSIGVILGGISETQGYSWDGTNQSNLYNMSNIIGTAYNDYLLGKASDNIIEGNGGADTIIGGGGSDTASFASLTTSIGVILGGISETQGYSWDGINQSNLYNMSNIIGTAYNDYLLGNASDNIIEGNGGADTIIGGGGSDTVSFASLTTGIGVILGGISETQGYSWDGTNQSNLYNMSNIIGSSHNDYLVGNASNNSITGGAGDDRFVAATNDGSDTYNGGDGTDTLDMSAVMTNINANLITGAVTTNGVTDLAYGIENIVLGAGNDTVTASADHNLIDLGAGDDTIVFTSAANADGDTIVNFEAGDQINVHALMNGTLTLVGTATANGDIAQHYDVGTDHTVVSGIDANGNHFSFHLQGHHVLTGTDFAA